MRGHYEIEGNVIRVSFRDDTVSLWIAAATCLVLFPFVLWGSLRP